MEWKDKKIVVMGLGLFGGGVAVARYFMSQGARVVVTDLRGAAQLQESLDELKGLPIEYHLGGHRNEDFRDSDLIVVNPGVPDTSPYLRLALKKGISVDTEMNLFVRQSKAPIIGITGSNGKSTTTAMIAHILKTNGFVTWLGGNIGKSLLEELPHIRPTDQVVMEMSSFQLERMEGISPHVAVVTNLSPNHLDRHGSMENYGKAKQNILRYQRKEDRCVLNARDPEVGKWGSFTEGKPILYGASGAHVFVEHDVFWWREGKEKIPVMTANDLPLPGRANQENAMAAIAVALSQGIDPQGIARAMRSFVGLPHRMQLLGQFLGRIVYEDSDATTPESTMVALDCLSGPIVLIAGGSDKGFDYARLGKAIAQQVKVLIVLGQTGPAIKSAVLASGAGSPDILDAKDLEEAVRHSRDRSSPGDTLLFSPASASFGMFRNFVERANVFHKLVLSCFQQ